MDSNINRNYDSLGEMSYYLELIPYPIIVHNRGRIVFANKVFNEKMHIKGIDKGTDNGEICGRIITDFIHPEYHQIVNKRIEKIEKGIELEDCELKLLTSSGSIYIVEANSITVNYSGTTYILSIFQDISQRKTSERKLFELRERYRSLFDYNPDAIISADKNGLLTYVNSATERLSGYSKDELLHTSFNILFKSEDSEMLMEKYNSIISGHAKNYECSIIRRNGEEVIVSIKGFPMIIDGQITGAYAVVKDITKQVKLQEKINNMAYNDALTELGNRYALEKTFNSIVQNNRDIHMAVIFIDLDNFKKINDAFGHSFGDDFLKKIAERIEECLSEKDIVFRYGGDEFVIISPYKAKKSLVNMVDNILYSLSSSFIIQEREIYTSPSIGLSLYPQDGLKMEDLIRHADIAMYEVKKEGKNNYKFYKDIFGQIMLNELNIENNLRKALRRKEFTLFYQPLIDLNTGLAKGVEALIRWQHPEQGIIMPNDFIPTAEKTGLIIPIGEWVLETACRQCRIWNEKGISDLIITVNISERQLKDSCFIKKLEEILSITGLDPTRLELEIVENVVNYEEVLSTINRVKKMGIKISIDDFGKGYSSLNILRHFSVDTLKIDKSFINDYNHCKTEKILETIIDLSNKLRINLIAEGIETEEQYQFLKEKTCRIGQGYLFNKPLPEREISKILLAESIPS